MVLRSALLLAALTPSVNGFLFEFKKDPVPNSQSYWILGEVTVIDKTSKPMLEKSSVQFDIKTVLDDVKAASSLDEKMKDISVGITESWVMDNLSKDIFCCGGENKENGCQGSEFSLNSQGENAKFKSSTYSVNLKEVSELEKGSGGQVFSPVKPGTFYFWIANCASGTDNLKLAGNVKVKSAHGYLAPETLLSSTICFYIGFLYVLLMVVFLFYPFSAAMKPMTITFAAFACTIAVRLIIVVPYSESLINVTGVEDSGTVFIDSIVAVQCCVFFLLWDMINSQYTMNTPSTIVEKGVLGLSCLGITAVIMGQSFFRHAADGRPPMSFFENAKKGLTAVEDPKPGSLEAYGVTMTDLYYMIFLLVVLMPILTWTERKEATLSTSEFSKRVLLPLRSKLMILVLLLMIVLVGFDFVVSKTTKRGTGSSMMHELSFLVDRAVSESALLLASITVAYYLAAYDMSGDVSGSAYGKVAQEDVELGQVEAEVDDYDPDKLTETRVRLE